MTDTALATATVVWRARAVGQDTDDPGNAPQEYPLAGVKVRLIPSPRKIEVAAPPGGVAPTTYTLRTWDLVTREDGSLVNPEDPGGGGSEAAGVQTFARFATVDAGRADGRVGIRVIQIPTSGSVLLVCRFVDSNNQYRVSVDPLGRVQLARFEGGALNSLASISVQGTVVAGDLVELGVTGNQLRVLINGVQRLVSTDAVFTDGTRFGLSLPPDTVFRLDDFILYDK